MALRPGTRLGSFEIRGRAGRRRYGQGLPRARHGARSRALTLLPEAFGADPDRLIAMRGPRAATSKSRVGTLRRAPVRGSIEATHRSWCSPCEAAIT
jgi:hypothetical protein